MRHSRKADKKPAKKPDRILNLDAAKQQTICCDCVTDLALKSYIRYHARSTACSFCHKTSDRRIGIRCDYLVRHIFICLGPKYIDGNWLRDATPDADEVGMFCTTQELLRKELPRETNQAWLRLLEQSLGDGDWCTHVIGDKPSLGDGLVEEWEQFCDFIKHERRHFFLQEKERRGSYDYSYSLKGRPFSAVEVLSEMGRACEEFRLVTTLKRGTVVFRARQSARGRQFRTTLELGPPNEQLARKPNRMSPSGVVMFYACDSPKAAIAEISAGSLSAVVGEFVIEKDIRILDLSCLPREASLFDLLTERQQGSLEFLHHFAAALSAKVEPDGHEHVEYVPSQVISEWFRTVFRHQRRRIHGICYPSVQYPDGRCLALFANQSDLVLPPSVSSAAINYGIYPDSIPSLSAMFRILAEQEKPWLRLLRTQLFVKGRPWGVPRKAKS